MKMHDASNVILIGMPGAGKSTLGVVLAKILNKGFIDCDLVIQQHFAQTLQQLIDEQGAEGFIALEGRVLEGIEATNQVIATGGSAVYSPAAMRHLAQLGPVVYLRVTLESLMARLGDLHERGVVVRGEPRGVCDETASATTADVAHADAALASTATAGAAHADAAHADVAHAGAAHAGAALASTALASVAPTPTATATTTNATGHKVLEELYQERYHLYEYFADIIVDVDNLKISDAALKVVAALKSMHEQCSAASDVTSGAAGNDAAIDTASNVTGAAAGD